MQQQAPPQPASGWSTRKKTAALGVGLALLVGAVALGIYYGGRREAEDMPKSGSPAGAVGTFSTASSGPVILPSPVEKKDTAAKLDQVIDMVQPSATVPAIDQGEPLTFSGGSPVTPASKFFTGAALPDMASMAETQGNAKLQEFVDKIAERSAQSNQLEAALAQFQKAVVRKEACTPKDAKALVQAVAEKCLYIKLVPGAQYNLTKVAINVTYPLAIVGDPFNRPLLDGRKTPRIFNVLAGGFLDLQHVRVIRGTVRAWQNGLLSLAIGGAALIYPGAGGNFMGCVFLNPLETWLARNIKGGMILGGNVLNLGGLITFTNCHFFNMSPTAFRFGLIVGGDILTVAGVTVESGCTHTQSGGIVVGMGVAGIFTAVLGGVNVMSGCVLNRNLGMQFGAGAGIQAFIGGGVGIFSGVVMNTQGGLFAMFGVAVKQWLGAGVLINSGVVQNKQFGANIFSGAGTFMGVGAGVNHNSGCNFNLNSGQAFVATSGIQGFLGAGHMSHVGSTWVRTFGLVAAYGLGGTLCSDSGDLEIIGSPTAMIAGIAGTAMLSLQNFMAAGYMAIIRSPAIRVAALYWRAGQGIAAYVGAGNLTVIRTRDTFRGFKGYAHTLSGKRQVKYFCHGQPYTEKKKVPVIMKPPMYMAATPQPKPFNPPKPPKARALQEATATATATATAARAAGIFKAAINAYDGPTAACFDGVQITDTKGGSLPAPGTLVKGLLGGNAKALFDGGVTDCESPFMGSEFKLDACTVKDSTLTGCAGEGYLGLATQDAEVCGTQGTCKLPVGLASDAMAAVLAAPDVDVASTGDRRMQRHQRLLQQQAAELSAVVASVGKAGAGGSIQVMKADVMLTCKARGACKDAGALKDAMAEYLNLGKGAKLSVSLDQLDPLVARNLGMDTEPAAAAGGDGECDAVVEYNLYVVTKDPALAAQFKAAMLEFNKPHTNDAFTAALRTASAFAGLCTIAGLVSFDFGIPLADIGSNTVGDTTASAITPAVAVMDESGMGIDKMQPGQTVALKLTKFPTDNDATVALLDTAGNVAATVASVTPQSSSAELVSWKVPKDLAPGFYIFSASPASNVGIQAMSSIIKVTADAGAGARGLFGKTRRAG